MPAPYRAAVIAAVTTLFCGLGLLIDDGKADVAVVTVAITVLLLTLTRVWTLRTGRAFVHGYHAGYHDAAAASGPEPCIVLSLAEVRNETLRRLPA